MTIQTFASVILISMATLATPVRAQSFLRYFESAPESAQGFRIDEVSLESSYYSAVTPFGAPSQIGPGTPVFGADVGNTVAATISYHVRRPTSILEIDYTPSYDRYVRNSQLNRMNHELTITTSHPFHLTPRLTLDFDVNASITNARQYLFNFGNLNRTAASATSADELAGSVVGTPVAGGGASQAAATAPTLDSAAQQLFFGNRILIAGVNSKISYAWSPRLNIGIDLGGSRYQHLGGGEDIVASQPGAGFLLNQTTTGIAGITASYSLSPRVEIGGDVTTSRNFSRQQQGFATTSTFRISRRMGQYWFSQVHAGVAIINVNGNVTQNSKEPQYLVGADVGFKTRANTFLVSPQRTITNMFGVVYNTTDVQATWIWQSQRRTWQLSSGGGYQSFDELPRSKVSAWRGTIALGRKLGSQLVGQLQYSQMRYSGGFDAGVYRVAQRGVMLALSWVPSAPNSAANSTN
jgi:hypothetical protein